MARWLVFLLSLTCWAAAPKIFFTDLVSGPNSGGESSNGAYVTLYGSNFGATRGTSTVTIGGGAPAQYKVWSAGSWGGPSWDQYDKVTVQLGASAATGNIVLTTSAGASNAIAFTVRSGTIYFVATSGSDGAAGTFAAPWATLTHARDTMASGDTVYARTGSYLTMDDGAGWATCMVLGSGNQGTSGSPNAMLAYPGETVDLGDATNCASTIRSKGSGAENYWVFAGFHSITGTQTTFLPYGVHDWRIVGNASMTCPPGNSQSGCLDMTGGLDGSQYNYWIYGNNINHAGTANLPGAVTALYHGYYISQQTHALDFGWNVVSNVYGGRCIQENVNGNNATDRAGSYDLHIHDSVLHDCQNDGIVMTTLNPVLGTVELYNNVIYSAGTGPANMENSGAWNCMNIQGWSNTGVTGESGVVQVYNNTMYACGTWSSPPFMGSSGGILWEDGNTSTKSVNLQNNIIQLTTGPVGGFPYFNVYSPNTSTCSSACAAVTGSNNIVFGNGGTPTNTTATSYTNSDPLLTAPGSANFTLQSASPAKNGGVTIGGLTLDIAGLTRPQNTTYSLGAYELPATGGTTSVSVSSTSSTQAILAGRTTQTGTCTVEVSTSASYTPLAYDVDGSLYTNANLVSRETYLVTGGEWTFVVGKRITQRDLAGIPRSRALQSATAYYWRVVCNTDTVTGVFATQPWPWGLSRADNIQADTLSPGDPLWPYFDYADKTAAYVDPHNGMVLHRTTGPGDSQYAGGSLNVTWGSGNMAKYPTGGAWALTGGTFPATITNNATDFLILRLDTSSTGTAGGVDFFNYNASASYTSEQMVSPNNFQTSLTGSINQATCNSVVTDACRLTVCISVDSVTCHPSAASIDVAFTTTGVSYTLGNQTYTNLGGWISAGRRIINSVESAKRTGTAVCNGSTAVTGGPFNLSMTAGSLITINSTVFTIASVQNEAAITLTTTCGSGTFSFVGKNFSLLVRAKTANSNIFTLTAGSTQVTFGVAPAAPAGENQDVCSFTTVLDVSGVAGYNCVTVGGFVWVSASTGEGRMIASPWETDATGLHLLSYQMMTFDGTNADIWYGIGNGNARIFKYHYFGDHANITFAAETGMTICNSLTVPTNKPCTTQEELTVNGVTDVADLVHSFSTAFDKTKWVAYPIGTNQRNGTFIILYKRNDGSGGPQNNSMAWLAAFDPIATTNSRPSNAGCVGGGNPGCIVAAMGDYAAQQMRGVDTKGGVQSDSGDGIVEFGPFFTCLNGTLNGAGCQKMDITGGFAFSSVTDAAGGPTDCPANGYGITGKNCTVVTVTSEPYDADPGSNETGAPSEYLTSATGDVVCPNITTVGGASAFLTTGDTSKECMRVIVKSSLTLTLQRHYQYGWNNSICTACLTGSATALSSSANPSLWYVGGNGNAYWDFVNDPTGITATLNQHGVGTHAFLRRGIFVQGTTANPPCSDTTSGCDMLTYASTALSPPLTTVPDPTGAGTVNPPFAGVTGIAVANGTQSHPSGAGLSADEGHRPIFHDARPYNGIYATSSGAPQSTSVSGSLYKFASGAITLHRKQIPTHATNGVRILTDVSGAGSSIGTTSTDYYKYCVVLATNECRSGSAAGEIYFNTPYLQFNFCYSPGQATSGADNTDICVHDQSIADDAIIEQSARGYDPTGLNQRVLTASLATPRVNAPFWNIFMTPASGIGFTRSKYVNNFRADYLSTAMPSLTQDSRVRTDYLSVPIAVPDSQYTHAMVEWGYLEEGSNGTTLFYCTSRADNCRSGGSPFTYASETQNPTSCASGCTISIPLVANRAPYFRILRTNSGGTVLATGTTQVMMVQ